MKCCVHIYQALQMYRIIKQIIWWRILSFFTVASLLVALYAPVIPWWIERCLDPDGLYNHAFLIPAISAWLIWQNRGKICQIRCQPCPKALGLIVAGLFLQLFGVFVETRFLVFLSLVVVLIGLMWAWLGTAFVRTVWFPLVFLFFAVPLDPVLVKFSTALQIFSARLTGAIAGLVGIPVSVSGAQLSAHDFGILVVPECNGLRYTVSLLALATLVATHVSGILRKIILIFGAFPIAVIANAIRITAVMLIGQYWGKEVAVGFYHNLSGVLVFGIAVSMLIGLAALMRQSKNGIAQETNGIDKIAKELGTESQRLREAVPMPVSFNRLNVWVTVLLGLSLLLGMGIKRIYDAPYVINLKKLVPTTIKGWHTVDEDVSHSEKERNWVLWRVYEDSNGRQLILHVVATPGWRGMRDYEACLVSSGWNPIGREKVLLPLGDGVLSEAQALWLSRSDNARLLSLYVYLSGGKLTANFYYVVWRSLINRHSKNWLGTLQFEIRMLTDDKNADKALVMAKEFLMAICQPLANSSK